MTYCSTIAKPLMRRIEAGKTLDEIGAELCGKTVKRPRLKAIRLIKELLDEETLIQYAKTLKYDVEKIKLGKKRKASPQRKVSEEAGNDSAKKQAKKQSTYHSLPTQETVEAVRPIVERFGLPAVIEAITIIRNQEPSVALSKEDEKLI